MEVLVAAAAVEIFEILRHSGAEAEQAAGAASGRVVRLHRRSRFW